MTVLIIDELPWRKNASQRSLPRKRAERLEGYMFVEPISGFSIGADGRAVRPGDGLGSPVDYVH